MMRLRFLIIVVFACALPSCLQSGAPDRYAGVATSHDDNILLAIASPTAMPVGEPYNRIKEGMTYREVIRLLGRPAHEGGSGVQNLAYAVSPTESFVVRTDGEGDRSVVMKYFYTKYREPPPAEQVDGLGAQEGARILERLKLPEGMLSEGYDVVIRQSPEPKIPRDSQLAVLFLDRLVITVNRFEDVERFVTITSDNDSLQFVRLHSLFSGGNEVAADGKVDGFDKRVPANILQLAGVENPRIEKDEKGWKITRYEIRAEFPNSEIHKMQEHVSKDSHYELLSDQKKYAGDIPGIEWMGKL